MEGFQRGKTKSFFLELTLFFYFWLWYIEKKPNQTILMFSKKRFLGWSRVETTVVRQFPILFFQISFLIFFFQKPFLIIFFQKHFLFLETFPNLHFWWKAAHKADSRLNLGFLPFSKHCLLPESLLFDCFFFVPRWLINKSC